MGGYLDILRSPAGTLMVVSGLARLAWGVEGLALVFHVEDAADSFAAAGLAVGALGLTSALFAPLRGALVDHHGGPALLSMALATATVIAAIAVTPAVGPQALSYIVLAALTGVVAPPFTAWTRAGLARRLSGDPLRHAYAVDNVFEESAFILGPLLAGLVIAVATPGVALGLAAGLAAFGGLALTVPPATREWAPARRAVAEGSRTGLNRPLAVAFVCLAGLGAGVGFVEVAVAAFAEGEGSEGSAGLILAGLSAGGILGAFVYGARTWRGSTARQYAVLLGLMGAGLALLAVPESVWVMVLLTALAGLAFTPVFIANSLLIEELSPGRPSAVAFTWVSTAMNAGVAAGAAAGGALVDESGTDPAFIAAGAVVLASAALALALEPPFRRSPVSRARGT
jgi:predicted MFS family arabinose efflux permease